MDKLKAFFGKFRKKTSGTEARDASDVPQKVKYTPSSVAMTVIGILLCVILIPILIFNLTLTIKGAVNKDEVPMIFGASPLIVLSGSMEPTIMEGDLVFVKKVNADELSEGDIIAYKESTRNGWEVVTHRIKDVVVLETGETVFKMRGDNNFGDDVGYVKKDQVVGIYTGRVAKVGTFMMKMQEPIGMALFIGVPVVLFIGLDVLRRYLYARKNQPVPQTADAAAELKSKNDELEAIKAELERLKAAKTEVSHSPEDGDNGDGTSL